MEVSFKGKLISGAEIYKRNFFNRKKYSSRDVNFVKLDAFDDADYELIEQLSKKWGNSFAKSIKYYSRVVSLGYSTYVLTKQQGNFEKLKSKKVLGIAQGWDDNNGHIHLEYLQVKPKYMNIPKKELGKYKSIGTTMIDCFKNLKNVKIITLNSISKAIDFYKKQGFVNRLDTHPFSMIWQKSEWY